MKYSEIKGYLIAIDLDGTAVSGFDDYDKESFKILKELSKNNYIVIATGRPFRSSKYFYDILNLKTPIINYNGALLHNPNDKNFKKEMIHIDKQKLVKFIENNKDILVNVFCEIEDDIFLMNDEERIMPYLHLDGGTLYSGSLNDILNDNPNGAILFSKPGSEERLNKYIKEIYNDEVKIRHWWTKEDLVSELYNPLTSKAHALEVVRNYYSIPKNKTIAIGDGHNDIEMLEESFIGVAMKNSHPDLLKVADYITNDVYNHGIKEFFINYDFKN